MNYRSLLRRQASAPLQRSASRSTVLLDRRRPFPPPDPAMRVEWVPDIVASNRPRPRGGGELIVAAGVGAILISACSKFIQLFDLPSLSEVTVAALGAALAVLGVLKHRGAPWFSPELAEVVVQRSIEVDLPSLTGQLSLLLGQLREQHGVVYRTRTWIEEVLPSAGAHLADPTLARDLLAAAALDAGGIRADVAGLTESHSRADIVTTSSSLIEAMQEVLATCEQSTGHRAPRPSDPSCWPPSVC